MVSGSLFTLEEDEQRSSFSSFTYTEKFNEVFPYYLSIGMTYEQFWNDDPYLVRFYRKAEELRMEKQNQALWLQGMYFYEAICDVSPILHAFAKKGTTPAPYAKEPYPLNNKQIKRAEKDKDREVFTKGKKIMEAFMERNNNRFKEVRDNVHDN